MKKEKTKAPEIRCERVDESCWIAWAVGRPGLLAQGESEAQAREELDLSLYVMSLCENGDHLLL